jgi:hypothetical protein
MTGRRRQDVDRHGDRGGQRADRRDPAGRVAAGGGRSGGAVGHGARAGGLCRALGGDARARRGLRRDAPRDGGGGGATGPIPVAVGEGRGRCRLRPRRWCRSTCRPLRRAGLGAVRFVPLGQAEGQRILAGLAPRIEAVARRPWRWRRRTSRMRWAGRPSAPIWRRWSMRRRRCACSGREARGQAAGARGASPPRAPQSVFLER